MLVIHGGFHKTGTTDIQRALAQGVPRGWHYVPEGYRGLASSSLSTEFIRQVHKSLRKHSVVISSEATFGSMEDLYSDAGDKAMQITQAFDDVEFRVVLFVRPLHEWLESVFVQLVQQSKSVQTEPFLQRFGPINEIGWMRVISEIEEVIGSERIRLVPYSSDADSKALFGEAAGLSLHEVTTRRSNVSINPAQAAIMSIANEVLDQDQSRYLRRILQASPQSFPQEKMSPFPHEVQLRLLERSRQDWRLVSRDRSDDDFSSALERSIRSRPIESSCASSVSNPLRAGVQDVIRLLLADAQQLDQASIRRRTRRRLGAFKSRLFALDRQLPGNPIRRSFR